MANNAEALRIRRPTPPRINEGELKIVHGHVEEPGKTRKNIVQSNPYSPSRRAEPAGVWHQEIKE